MSVVGVIASLSTSDADGGYVVSRTTNAGYDGATGDAIAGTVTTFPIDAVVEPSNGRRLVGREEGRHTEDTIAIFTEASLRVGSIANLADTLVYLGETYEVLRVDGPFNLSGGTHYECYAARLVTP